MLKRKGSFGGYGGASKAFKAAYKPMTKTEVLRIAKRAVAKSQEVKQILSSATSAGGSTATLVLMNPIAQGIDDGQHIGDSVSIKEIAMTMLITQSLAAVSGDTYRVLVVYDKQANGAAPTAANILDNQIGGLDAIAPYNSDYIPPKGGMGTRRFTILYDKLISFDHFQIAAGGQVQKNLKFHWGKGNLKTNYIGTGATVASIGSGSVYLLQVAVNNTNLTSASAQWEVNYTDA